MCGLSQIVSPTGGAIGSPSAVSAIASIRSSWARHLRSLSASPRSSAMAPFQSAGPPTPAARRLAWMTAASRRPASPARRNSSRAASRSRGLPSPASARAASPNKASASLIAAGEPFLAHAETVKEQAGQVARRAAEPAVAAPARRGRERVGLQHAQPAPADPAGEIDILHQRERGIASDAIVERARYQQALIAIRKAEPPDA